MDGQAPGVTPPKQRQPITGWAAVAIVAGIVLAIAGFVHVVTTSDGGLKFCAKESWSLSGTFVDAEDFIGKPAITLLDRASTIRALVKCEVLRLPDSWNRP